MSALDVPRCHAIAVRGGALTDAEWKSLLAEIWPFLELRVKRNRTMGSLARSDDNVRDVMTAVVARLSPTEGNALAGYADWCKEHEREDFDDWLRIVVSFAIRDYVRAALGRSTKVKDPDLPSVKRLLNEFASSPASDDVFGSERPQFTLAQTARQLLAFARESLSSDQHRALSLWLDDVDFGEIEGELGLDGEEAARKLVRAALATLRRRFAISSRAPRGPSG
ncbi:MAG: hypothetical protein U0414_26815 [Polyangiaceae bacterium]